MRLISTGLIFSCFVLSSCSQEDKESEEMGKIVFLEEDKGDWGLCEEKFPLEQEPEETTN